MTCVLRMDQALYRLLHHRTAREAFLAGRYEELGWPDELLQAFATVDPDELSATAKQICRNLLAGERGFNRGLRGAYSRVFQALEAGGRKALEVVYAFVESDVYAHYRELPYAGEGICVEEAFYEFLQRDPWFVRDARMRCLLTHEFLTALMGILTVNQDPAFRVRTELVQDNGAARFAVLCYPRAVAEALGGRTISGEDAEVCWLYAATKERFIGGPVSELVAEVMLGMHASDGREEAYLVMQKLTELGLLQKEEQLG
ncbi:hypothetical protein EV586_103595 [Tumebacillus sp. BK434]|uniref:hypothetical protein n=1 Tax=Tumebacillus sp. BK434 TaxID=2512169 RepID=UPI001048286A|nr:hypothetical protein [Tumebacillus sp. BK434]TCP55936.1 hypothetical protein EV586_103595 [Tumebacillus sp. BK434]